jgi:hypothetical protein
MSSYEGESPTYTAKDILSSCQGGKIASMNSSVMVKNNDISGARMSYLHLTL